MPCLFQKEPLGKLFWRRKRIQGAKFCTFALMSGAGFVTLITKMLNYQQQPLQMMLSAYSTA